MAVREPLDPRGCAVVTMEMQRGVVGDLSHMAELRQAVETSGVIGATVRLVDGARSAGAQVIHAIAHWRADRKGTSANTPLARALWNQPRQILRDAPESELLPELGPEPPDLISARGHGLTPFSGTDLDALLRAVGAHTVIACGVSLNVGVLGLVLSAADLGYRVVVATDAVTAVPPAYADQVMVHTLSAVAELATVDGIVAAFDAP